MAAPAKWGLIGFGNIGHEVVRQLGQPAVAARLALESMPTFIAVPEGIMQADGKTPADFRDFSAAAQAVAVVFIAIPSSDDGKAAYRYITQILKAGAIAVTAEKGATANYYTELKQLSQNFNRFGITATVGGGTRLLQVAREYCQDTANISQIHLALNGTLSAILGWVAPTSGTALSLDAAAKKAVAQGFAEPGSTSATAIIRGEAEGDIPKKVAIFCNSVNLSQQLVDWNSLRFTLTDDEITTATQTATPRRFIVSLYPATNKAATQEPEADIVGGFTATHEDWQIVGGFRRIDANPLFSALTTLTGPGNGMVIGLGPAASDGVYAVTGPGAGVNPTVNTMLDDYVRLKSYEA